MVSRARRRAAAIPAPAGVQDPVVERILWAIREQLSTGVASADEVQRLSSRVSAVEASDPVSGGSAVTPSAVTGLTATGIFGAVVLEWDATPDSTAYVEVFAADVDDIGQASYIGESRSRFFTHYRGEAGQKWYWVRGVWSDGETEIRGPYNATDGTPAAPADDPTYVKDVLTGELTTSELHSDLNSRIDLIDGPESLAGSVNERIQTEAAALQSQIDTDVANLNQEIQDRINADDALDADIQSEATTRSTEDEKLAEQFTLLFVKGGDANVTRSDTAPSSPATGDFWLDTSGSAPVLKEWDGSDWQVRDDIDADSINASIASEQQARIDGDSALASDITALDSRVTTAEGDITTNAGAISALDTRVTTAEGEITSQGQAITALESTVNDPDDGVAANASAVDSLDTRVTTAEGNISTNASDISSLDSRITTAEGDISGNASAISALDTRVTTAEGNITSNASDISALESTVNDPSTGVAANASAVDSLDTRVTSAEGDISAISSDVTQLQTDVGDNTATITTHSSSISGLEAQRTVKIDNNGRVAGYGLASAPTDEGGIESTFGINANNFFLSIPSSQWQASTAYADGEYVRPTGAGTTDGSGNPLVYGVQTPGTSGSTEPAWPTTPGATVTDGGVTWVARVEDVLTPFVVGSVGGQPTVAIDGAYIEDLTVESAALKEVEANKIVAASLSAISANLGTVTAGTFQTDVDPNFRVEVSSQGGYPIWAGSGSKTGANALFSVDSTGKVVMRSATSGGRLEIDHDQVKVYDTGGTLRVLLGRLS